jgi:hypothetical protein
LEAKDPGIHEQAVGGAIGMDEDDELLTAVRETSEAAKRDHKAGTKGVSQTSGFKSIAQTHIII